MSRIMQPPLRKASEYYAPRGQTIFLEILLDDAQISIPPS